MLKTIAILILIAGSLVVLAGKAIDKAQANNACVMDSIEQRMEADHCIHIKR